MSLTISYKKIQLQQSITKCCKLNNIKTISHIFKFINNICDLTYQKKYVPNNAILDDALGKVPYYLSGGQTDLIQMSETDVADVSHIFNDIESEKLLSLLISIFKGEDIDMLEFIDYVENRDEYDK